MYSQKVLGSVLCIAFAACATTAAEEVDEASQALTQGSDPAQLTVKFHDCIEYAGVGAIPYANARAAVPEMFAPFDTGDGHGLAVVRAARCADTSVDGESIGPGTVSQVGVRILPPDGDGDADIDNYTLHYDTDSRALSRALKAAGVVARNVRTLSFEVSHDETQLCIDDPLPSDARYALSSAIKPQYETPSPFVANWWAFDAEHKHKTKTRTALTTIYFGQAQTKLQPDERSPLRELLDPAEFKFSALDSYNWFDDGTMTAGVR